jgi:hypothetical protein
MVEGIIGSGKTTTASGIHRFLDEHGIASEFFLEGDIHHPADYEHTAWLGTDDWAHLLSQWPAYRTSLEAVSQPADGGVLVPYGVLEDSREKPLPDALSAALASRSVYDGTPLDCHRRLLTDHWREFARARQASETVTILECCFLQNPLSKFIVQHAAAPSTLVEHLSVIAEALRPLHPVVLYLAPPDIEGTIGRIVRERSSEWRDAVIQYCGGGAFGRAHGLHGWDGFLTFLRQRPALERDILAQLPVRTVIIADDTAPQRWDRVKTLLSTWFPLS